MRWDAGENVKYWVTISPEFRKGHRYNDETILYGFSRDIYSTFNHY
jgi:heme-degrading monooxygenase HmoA